MSDRLAGIILHPTSLPGPHGIGDLGHEARSFIRWLAASGQRIWQVLPLHPVGFTGSPYSSPSASARNPLLLSLEDLHRDGWLAAAELPPHSPVGPVDYPAVIRARQPLLRQVASRIARTVDLNDFAESHPWVSDWALYATLAELHGQDWSRWPAPLQGRAPGALADALERHAESVRQHIALQWAFEQQWSRLRDIGREVGVQLWGDAPIFVGHDSADVWCHPELFQLDGARQPTAISGVPPDAFSPLGQLWGHPLYDVAAHRTEGHVWWGDRLEALVGLTDCVRLDHFRGLAQMWSVPAGAEDARQGRWVPGLGAELLQALQDRFGEIPLYAEDLGVITEDVIQLRERFSLRGMAVLQFAWGPDPTHPYRPAQHRRDQVVCTGTHDNNTTQGWFEEVDPDTRRRVLRELGGDGSDIAWRMLRCAHESVAEVALAPMQDALGLGAEARMNVPGEAYGNWTWRMPAGALDGGLASRLARLADQTER